MTTGTQNVWALGDYDRIAALLVDMGPDLVEAAGVRPGHRVLDVGAGTGNAALAAAAVGADVTATDITPELLEAGERASRERGLAIRWQYADAQDLPFADGQFDVVLSCIGAMFAPDHEATARELLRVCRPGGTVAMANWTPDGAVGAFFALLARYAERPPAGPPPTAWGDPAHLLELFGDRLVSVTPRTVRLRFTGPPEEITAYYRRHFGPVVATFAGLDDGGAAALERDLVAFFAAEDRGGPDGPRRYELPYVHVLCA